MALKDFQKVVYLILDQIFYVRQKMEKTGCCMIEKSPTIDIHCMLNPGWYFYLNKISKYFPTCVSLIQNTYTLIHVHIWE